MCLKTLYNLIYILFQENDVEIVPSYLIGSKEVVKEREKARWTKKRNVPEVTTSWHNYMTKKIVQDFQASVLQVSETPYDEKTVSSIPTVHYEFPNGYHQVRMKWHSTVCNVLTDLLPLKLESTQIEDGCFLGC
jgi:hypothetical protein